MHTLHLSLLTSLLIVTTQCLPPTSTSPNFRITAAISPDSPLSNITKGWNLTTYHIDPTNDYLVLHRSPGRIFYNNGTDSEYSDHTSKLLSDGSTPLRPWGVKVASENATDDQGRRNVYVVAGDGSATPGVQVAEWPGTVYYGTGGWYVCNSTLLYGPAIALYYKEKVDRTPEGCANVELQAWCLDEGSGLAHAFARESTCYLGGD